MQAPDITHDPKAGPMFWATALALIGIAAFFEQTRPHAIAPPAAPTAWQPRPLTEVLVVPDDGMRPVAEVGGAVLYVPAGGAGGLAIPHPPARPAPAFVRVAPGRYLPVDRGAGRVQNGRTW